MSKQKAPQQEPTPPPVAKEVSTMTANDLIRDAVKDNTGRRSSFLTAGQVEAKRQEERKKSLLGASSAKLGTK